MERLAETALMEMGAQPAQSPFTPWLLTTLISSDTKPLGACPVSAIALASNEGQTPLKKHTICWARLPISEVSSSCHTIMRKTLLNEGIRNALQWSILFNEFLKKKTPICHPSESNVSTLRNLHTRPKHVQRQDHGPGKQRSRCARRGSVDG